MELLNLTVFKHFKCNVRVFMLIIINISEDFGNHHRLKKIYNIFKVLLYSINAVHTNIKKFTNSFFSS